MRVAVVDERGRPVAAGGLGGWLTRVAPASARGAVTIALASDHRVRALNKTYRRTDCATDVLSFAPGTTHPAPGTAHPAPGTAHPAPGTWHLAPGNHLGDVVIAKGVARRQARAAGHSPETELRVLALHGLLHLLGYDHETDHGEMARVERRLRKKGGLPASLTERALR